MTSTTMAETCYETHLPGLWRDIMRQAEDPWRTDIMKLVLDAPVAADVPGDRRRPGALRGEAGDAQRRYRRYRVAVQVGDVALDQERLGGVREHPRRSGQHLGVAALASPVRPACHHMLNREPGPGQGVQGVEQPGLVVLDRGGNVVGALAGQVPAG